MCSQIIVKYLLNGMFVCLGNGCSGVSASFKLTSCANLYVLHTMTFHLHVCCSCEETVCVSEATSAHLISYHPEKDLLPLVISCCQYTLTVGKGSAVTYDFALLQRQIEERFIRNRPRLDPKVANIEYLDIYMNIMLHSSA